MVQALTFVYQAAAESDTTVVEDLPTPSLGSTTTNLKDADAKNEGGAEMTEPSRSGTVAVSATQDVTENPAAAGDSDTAVVTGAIKETHRATSVNKTGDTTPAINPAQSDRTAWPDWMKKHVAHVEAAAISEEFKSLVQQYIKLEALLGFPKGQVRGDGDLSMNRS
jgi:hypothetical protein